MDVVWIDRRPLLRSVNSMNQQPRHRQQRARISRASKLSIVVLVLAATALSLTRFSGATFTSASANTPSSVRSSADWTPPTVSVQGPGAYVKASVTITATASDADSGIKTVAIQQRVDGGTAWTTLCTDTSAPYTCAWDTTAVANGAYDLRAVATDVALNVATSTVVRTTVDNLAPSVTLTDPGSPLSGNKTFTATATDAHSGVAQVVIQYGSGSTYTTLCTISSAPYTCSYDTAAITNGTYGFRAVATDKAGNATTSALIANRVVTNVTSTVALTDPGAYLRGTVTLAAAASSTGTISSVRIQRAPAGGSTWTEICSDTSSPYSCSLNTTTLTDGAYDFRAVLTDSTGRTTTSDVVSGRSVDNTAARAVDVQTTNGGVAGKIDSGDTIAFTYSERVNLGTVLSGWDGSATSVNVRVRDGLLISLNPNNDVLDVTGVNLGSVSLDENFVNTLGTINVTATMTASTVTVDGVARTVVTLRITSTAGLTASGNGTMTWTPSALVTDLAGNPTSTVAVSESGAGDRDF